METWAKPSNVVRRNKRPSFGITLLGLACLVKQELSLWRLVRRRASNLGAHSYDDDVLFNVFPAETVQASNPRSSAELSSSSGNNQSSNSGGRMRDLGLGLDIGLPSLLATMSW